MASKRTVRGPTPNGGAYSVAYFQDDDGNSADEEVATQIEIHEMSEDGRIIRTTYGVTGRQAR